MQSFRIGGAIHGAWKALVLSLSSRRMILHTDSPVSTLWHFGCSFFVLVASLSRVFAWRFGLHEELDHGEKEKSEGFLHFVLVARARWDEFFVSCQNFEIEKLKIWEIQTTPTTTAFNGSILSPFGSPSPHTRYQAMECSSSIPKNNSICVQMGLPSPLNRRDHVLGDIVVAQHCIFG